MGLNGNGGSIWPALAKSSIGILVTTVIALVSCQQATISNIGERITRTEASVDQNTRAIREREGVIQEYSKALQALDKSTTGDLKRLEIRMVRLEMLVQQMMLAENVQPPKGLPRVPPPEDS